MRKLMAVLGLATLFFAVEAADLSASMTIKLSPVKSSPAKIEPVDNITFRELVPSSSDPGHFYTTFSVSEKANRSPELAFKALSDGQINVGFFGSSRNGAHSVAVALLTVNGKPVRNQNYSKRNATGALVGFWCGRAAAEPELIAASDGNPAALRISKSRRLLLPLKVKAGETYLIGMRLTAMESYPEDVGSDAK